MASQGPNNPGTLANDAAAGTVAWSNPSNAASSNDSDATASLQSSSSQYLKATNFGFSLPAGAIVTGVQVEVERACFSAGQYSDAAVRIVKGGVIGSTDRSAGGTWPTSDTVQAYGGAGDLWGETLTDSDVEASTFGVALRVSRSGGVTPANAEVDHVKMTVYYVTVDGRGALLGVGVGA